MKQDTKCLLRNICANTNTQRNIEGIHDKSKSEIYKSNGRNTGSITKVLRGCKQKMTVHGTIMRYKLQTKGFRRHLNCTLANRLSMYIAFNHSNMDLVLYFMLCVFNTATQAPIQGFILSFCSVDFCCMALSTLESGTLAPNAPFWYKLHTFLRQTVPQEEKATEFVSRCTKMACDGSLSEKKSSGWRSAYHNMALPTQHSTLRRFWQVVGAPVWKLMSIVCWCSQRDERAEQCAVP